jgi:hypothetical protein
MKKLNSMNLKEVNKHANINWLECEKARSENNTKKVFHIARPILIFLSTFFIVPKKVRLIISHLIEVLDTIIPNDNDVSNISHV